jgi:hypothetical protein
MAAAIAPAGTAMSLAGQPLVVSEPVLGDVVVAGTDEEVNGAGGAELAGGFDGPLHPTRSTAIATPETVAEASRIRRLFVMGRPNSAFLSDPDTGN